MVNGFEKSVKWSVHYNSLEDLFEELLNPIRAKTRKKIEQTLTSLKSSKELFLPDPSFWSRISTICGGPMPNQGGAIGKERIEQFDAPTYMEKKCVGLSLKEQSRIRELFKYLSQIEKNDQSIGMSTKTDWIKKTIDFPSPKSFHLCVKAPFYLDVATLPGADLFQDFIYVKMCQLKLTVKEGMVIWFAALFEHLAKPEATIEEKDLLIRAIAEQFRAGAPKEACMLQAINGAQKDLASKELFSSVTQLVHTAANILVSAFCWDFLSPVGVITGLALQILANALILSSGAFPSIKCRTFQDITLASIECIAIFPLAILLTVTAITALIINTTLSIFNAFIPGVKPMPDAFFIHTDRFYNTNSMDLVGLEVEKETKNIEVKDFRLQKNLSSGCWSISCKSKSAEFFTLYIRLNDEFGYFFDPRFGLKRLPPGKHSESLKTFFEGSCKEKEVWLQMSLLKKTARSLKVFPNLFLNRELWRINQEKWLDLRESFKNLLHKSLLQNS